MTGRNVARMVRFCAISAVVLAGCGESSSGVIKSEQCADARMRPGGDPALFLKGCQEFVREVTPAEGLGHDYYHDGKLRFNATSCVKCHNVGYPGGSGDFADSHVPIVHDRNIGLCRRHFIGDGGQEQKCPVPDFLEAIGPGLAEKGEFDEIPDEEILKCGQDDALGIHGQPGRDGAGHVTRSSQATFSALSVADFVCAAFNLELGTQTDVCPTEYSPGIQVEVSEERVRSVQYFTHWLAKGPTPPQFQGASSEGFEKIGCATCHRLGGKWHGSDICRHDLGLYKARTAPLIDVELGLSHGLGVDGRAETFDLMVRRHQGEAAKVTAAYFALPEAERAAIEAFVRSQ